MINLEATREDMMTIEEIATRAIATAKGAGVKVDRLSLTMDITACHLNGNPLRLADLLAADDGNFGHDVFGIRRYMDRGTGQLTDCFSPRYSAPEPTTV